MRRIAILVGFALAAAPRAGGAPGAAADPLGGKTFRSLERLPGGERRDGTVAQVRWEISFQGKSYSWLHSDIIATGTYEYDTRTGALAVKAGGRQVEASYDAKAGVLTWDKHKYEAAEIKK